MALFACDAEHVVSAAHLFHYVLFFFLGLSVVVFLPLIALLPLPWRPLQRGKKLEPIPAFHTQTTTGMM